MLISAKFNKKIIQELYSRIIAEVENPLQWGNASIFQDKDEKVGIYTTSSGYGQYTVDIIKNTVTFDGHRGSFRDGCGLFNFPIGGKLIECKSTTPNVQIIYKGETIDFQKKKIFRHHFSNFIWKIKHKFIQYKRIKSIPKTECKELFHSDNITSEIPDGEEAMLFDDTSKPSTSIIQ